MTQAGRILKRIARSVLRTESLSRHVGTGGLAGLDGSLQVTDFGAHHMWVRVTGAVDGDGHYPGFVCQFNAADNTLTDGATILVREVNGGKLKTVDGAGATLYYFARAEGDFGGTEVFVPVSESGGNTTVTGTTDYGSSGSAGTSPPGVLKPPSMTVPGPPTWTPAASGKAYEIDSNAVEWWYNGSFWVNLNSLNYVSTSSTNSPVLLEEFIATSTGTPASGFGVVTQAIQLTNAGAITVPVSDVSTTFVNAGSGTFTVRQDYNLHDSGADYVWLNLVTDTTKVSALYTADVTYNGTVVVGNGTSPGEVKFLEGSGSGTNYVSLISPTTLAGSTTYTLPAAYPASSGYVLSSTTGGTLSWAAPPSGTISGLTQDVLPKADVGGASLVDSSFVDDGSLISIGTLGHNTVSIFAGGNSIDINSNGLIAPNTSASKPVFTDASNALSSLTSPATVTGSRGGNAALADLLTKLAALGLIVDGSS